MNISMWSSFFYEDTPETMLAKLASCGYRHTELSYEHAQVLLKRSGSIAQTAAAFSACADEHGISIPQAHLTLSYDPVAVEIEQRTRNLDGLKREIELFTLLGVKAAVLHINAVNAIKAGWTQAQVDDVRCASLQTLCEATAGSGMRFAMENLSWHFIDAPTILRVIDLSGCQEHLGICLDTGHLHLVGGDLAQFVREAGEALIALHIADNLGEKDNHLFPFGGTIAWHPFLEALRELQYKGLFNFEVPGERIREAPFPAQSTILLHKARYAYKLAQLMIESVSV